jgi:hypothetical protein
MKYLKGRWNLLIASVIIFVIAIFQWNRWGINILQELNDGDFFFLGGPSLFYPTALFPSLVAVGYFITFLFTLGIVKITKEDNNLHISEKKGWISQEVSISYDSITSASCSNTKLRWSALGAIVLILSSYYLFIDGISLLTYDAVFGYGIDTGIYYVLQAIGNLIALIFVLFFTPGEIRIRSTKIDRIILSIPIIWYKIQKKRFESELSEILQISATRKSFDFQNGYLSLVYGLILISSSIISRIYLIFSNEILRIIYIFIGIYYLMVGIKHLSLKSKKGLWMLESTEIQNKVITRSVFYMFWTTIIVITLITVINNTSSILPGTNIVLIAILNCTFLLIMLFPGIWKGIHYISEKFGNKREKISL